jgi:hypothetical protein
MKHFCSLLVTVGLAVSAVSAQTVTEIKQPGDVIRLEVKFDGPDAAKVKQISVRLDRTGAILADQPGFTSNFQGNWVTESSPKTFHVDIKIPDGVATGEYKLSVNAQGTPGQTQYTAGEQFQLGLFHIRNPATFAPPSIQVKVIGDHL